MCEGIADTFGACVANPYVVASIRFEGWTGIPSVQCMGRPGFTIGWFFVCKHASARGAEWGAVEVEGAVEVSF